MNEGSLRDEIVSAFSGQSALDAADVLGFIEAKTGQERRLARVFNEMLDMAKDGTLVADRKEGKRTLYRLGVKS